MLIETIGSFVLGIAHQLGVKSANTLTQSKQKNTYNSVHSTDMTDEEIWNIVTSYGKYQEVWTIYRHDGLLQAIKARDEKIEFDRRVSQIVDSNPRQNTISSSIIRETDREIDKLDLAYVKGLASYFEEMIHKILRYHQDHHASLEEAKVIADYYQETAYIVQKVQSRKDLQELIIHIKNLKHRISRYQHRKYKYSWSEGLKRIILKLEAIK